MKPRYKWSWEFRGWLDPTDRHAVWRFSYGATWVEHWHKVIVR